MKNLDDIVNEATSLLGRIDNAIELEQAKARYLGKSGALTELLKGLGKFPADERPAMGSRINQAKSLLETTLKNRREFIHAKELAGKLKEEALDVTLPSRGKGVGGLHPVTQTLKRIESLFHSIGFDVASGPEIETDFYNFTALNIPE